MDQDVPFERVGGYRILRRLATGGTSDVLLARAEGPHGFERTVVLKLLLQQFRRDAPMEKMFAREAAAYARLSHPAIVKLYDFFSAEGQLVMVLEFIDGLPLNRFRAVLRKNGEHVDDRASIFIASRVFASLAAAHGARDPESGELAPVVHRDVNPSNILIPWDGHVKLADFGIAKLQGVTSDTQAGFIKGTYGYMAPEQVRGELVTARTDVYAASLLLWELLARRKAIQRVALPELEVLRAMAEPSLPSLHVLRPDLPQRLRDAIMRGLEPSPEGRSITAEEMLIVLRESVTSNEGRNVLAETLARVRAEAEATRQAGAAPPGSPYASPRAAAVRPVPVRAPSEVSIDGPMRTALGTGHVAALAAPMSTRPAKPPASPASPSRQVETLAFGLVREDVVPAAPMMFPADPQTERTPSPIGEMLKAELAGAPQSAIPPPPAALLAVAEEFERNPSTVPTPFSPPRATPPPFSTPPPPRTAPASRPPQPPVATPAPAPAAPVSVAPPPQQFISDPPEPPGVGKSKKYVLIAGAALLASAAVVAALLFSHGDSGAPAPVATVTATANAPAPVIPTSPPPTPPAPTPTPIPPSTPTAAAPAPPSSSRSGDIVTPSSARGHRVFVDGRFAGDSPGPIHVRCGQHTVKIGSGGVSHSVNVPCGGEVSVSPR